MIGEQVGRRVLTGRRVSKTSEAAFVFFFYINSMCCKKHLLRNYEEIYQRSENIKLIVN